MSLCQLVKLQSLSLSRNNFNDTKRAQYFLEKRLTNCFVDVDQDKVVRFILFDISISSLLDSIAKYCCFSLFNNCMFLVLL